MTPSEYNVGDRFSPTMVELITHFLMQKLLGNDHLVSRIPLHDVYQHSDDGEVYFFSHLHPKYPGTKNGRINRSTRTGSWQAKGKDYEIISQHNGEVIGIRRIFVHSCNEDGIKYVMHEFSIPNQNSLVLCKVMKKMPRKKGEGTCKKVKKRKEAAELPLPICNEDNSTLSSGLMKKKMPDKKSVGPCKKVKRTQDRADMPYNKENITPVPDEGSDFENWIISDKNDYNNIINDKDQQTEKSTFDNGGTNCLKTSSASVYHFADFTTPEDHQGDPEILPHLQSFSGYDQQDLSLDHDFTLDDLPLMLPEQVNTNNGPAGTSMSVPKDDLYIWLEPLHAYLAAKDDTHDNNFRI
ncbi:NAC domain-containing protein 96-like [Populus alba x Populus x berolinensis]|uniref:NAC domain-containing protein 96-like n=1 Tax=Populus alba x Populus x berolinensis TaxID=444605 RepID=A0AAD6PPF3_9ROSI|nr:NAC domain-containing protein 96-like [Populus alba x Populus x berolinensis]